MDPQSVRHLHALRNFVRNLVEQAERSDGCECHRPPSLLLVGPPGSGKTYLVKQMSNVCEMPLFGVHTHQLNGPKALKNLFKQAREIDYPSLFFLDDIDFIFDDHDKDTIPDPVVLALRQELYKQLGTRKLKIFDPDGIHNPVKDPSADCKPIDPDAGFDNNGLILVAATSSPWLLYKDHELLSRFRGVYLVGLPDKETRFHLIKSLLQKVQHNLTEKEIWLVAEKTDGFTPSDLMLVTKALNYKQFAFLISLAGGLEGSSDGGSLSSSEMTDSDDESDTESDSDQTEAAELSDSKDATVRKVTTPSEDSQSTCSDNVTVLANLAKDWESDEEEESSPTTAPIIKAFSSTPKKESVKKLSVATASCPDSDLAKALNDLDAACASPSRGDSPVTCDSNVSAIDRPTPSPVVSDEKELNDETPDSPRPLRTTSPAGSLGAVSDDAPKEFELRVSAAPDLDNDAGDSGSESDHDDSSCRRRVKFPDAGGGSLSPLSVEIAPSSTSSSPLGGYSPTAPAMPSPLEDDLKGLYGAVASSNILKCLLQGGDEDQDKLNNSKDKNRDPDRGPDNFFGVYGEDPLMTSGGRVAGAALDLCRNLISKTDNRHINSDNLASVVSGVAAFLPALANSVGGSTSPLTGRKSPLNGNRSPQLTPTGSDSSGRLTTDNTSDRGTRLLPVANSRDSGINKTRDSDSPTIPSSDLSSGTCNVSGETLECHSDSEDRFLKVAKGDSEEESADDADLRAIFNLNNLGEVTIKIITLEDVLLAIRQTPRSVTDEEIKKYTDFMVWFANVAKSACPHNTKNSTQDSSSTASLSVDSTDCSGQSRSSKKRKGALKKLGRFLLKALMLLLD